MSLNISSSISNYLYDKFMQKIIKLPQSKLDIISLINDYLQMKFISDLQQIEQLKIWLDSFRPFSPIIIAELKKLYDVQFTYNSNAIIEDIPLLLSRTKSVMNILMRSPLPNKTKII